MTLPEDTMSTVAPRAMYTEVASIEILIRTADPNALSVEATRSRADVWREDFKRTQ